MLMHLSWLLALLLGVWTVLFYVTMVREINDEVDDSLENYAEAVIAQSLSGRLERTEADAYRLRPVSDEYAASLGEERYSDEQIFFPGRDERLPARVLRVVFRDAQDRSYELMVMAPTLEKEDLRQTILGWTACLYGILLLSVLVVNLLVMRRMLRPLYTLLRWLDDYRVGRSNALLDNDTPIVEFQRLNDAARRNAERAEELHEQQKQFIGNASHEMQTPLAVCMNRLELLLDDAGGLDERQLGEIAKVRRTLDYLVRLNKSLLLLSKIENGQFPETETVDLNALVRRAATDMEEIFGHRDMRLTICEQGQLLACMNPSLAGSVVANLIKNAFVHGDLGGEVCVCVSANALMVRNSGAAGPLDAAHLFERFYQGTKKEGSTGLGLAIIEAICRLYGLRIIYRYEQGYHCFSVEFSA